MEAYLEPLVGSYLTRGGSVFISPQFDIAWDKSAGEGGASPDFVALDFEQKEYIVVEVTTSYNLAGLKTKIGNRDRHWYPPIRKHLEKLGVINELWKPRFLGFVRNDRIDVAGKLFPNADDVCFYPLEDALLEYAYSGKRKNGLPRRP